ncbi:MAG: hypothetical protein QG551_5 [Patescibacteria group bacterium]|jgi:hypothetical protein|nr:hypothetical protein [Patescibacteria group bacterium]
MEDNNIKNKSTNNPDYHKITTKLFYNSLLNIPLFAVPAFSALFLGKYLDARFGTDKTITMILLFCAFSLSWFLVLKKNSKLTKEYRSVREEMKKSEKDNEAKN